MCAGRVDSPAGAAPHAGKAFAPRTLTPSRRIGVRVDDTCQAHRCAGRAVGRRGSHRPNSPQRIGAPAFRLRSASARSATRRPPNSLVLRPSVVRRRLDHRGPQGEPSRSVLVETIAEQAVMTHENCRAGLRQAARALMVARRVLTTVSRSGSFPACGAVSARTERLGSTFTPRAPTKARIR